MFCKYCGQTLNDEASFCSKCGKLLTLKSESNSEVEKLTGQENISLKEDAVTEAEEKKFCKFCGIQLRKDALFCASCGKKLVIQINEDVHDKKTEEKRSNHRKNSSSSKKFRAKNLTVQVFKSHTSEERNEILKAGIVSSEEIGNIKIDPDNMQPWFYSRVFMILSVVFAVFEICLLHFNNRNLLPGVMLIGSVMVPFSVLTMYFELNVYKDISFLKVIVIFLLGGSLSLLLTLFFYDQFSHGNSFDLAGAFSISLIEESAKALVVIILINRHKNVTVLQGLLIGGAIGCGFAVFESAGYAFNVFLEAHDYNNRVEIANSVLPWYYKYNYTDSIGDMNSNIILRSVLSVGGHTAWAAITGAAFAKKNRISFHFVFMFAICVILHAVWDWDMESSGIEVNAYLKLTILCLLAWHSIIRLIAKFVTEKNQ